MWSRQRVDESRRGVVILVRVELLFEIFLFDVLPNVVGRSNSGKGGESFFFALDGGSFSFDVALGCGCLSFGFCRRSLGLLFGFDGNSVGLGLGFIRDSFGFQLGPFLFFFEAVRLLEFS